MDTKDLITLIGIGITLIVGVANLFNSLVTNKRTLYVNAVTSERVKWIGQLKDLLAEYSSLTYFYKQKKILQGAELNAYIEKLSYLRHRIKLHLNPVGEKDKKIVSLIDKINKKYILIYDFYKFTRGEIKTEAEYIKRIDRMVSLLDKEHLQELQEELDWFEKARKNDEEFDEESDEEFDEESDEEFDEESDEEFDEESDEESDEEFDEESDEEFDEESDEELKIKLYSEMIDKIKELIRRELGNKGRQDLLDWSNELVELAGMYLKEEWERVKIESHSGRTFKSTKVNQNSQLILLLFAGLYIIVGTLITAFFTELSWGLTFILFSFITYTIFVPFMKEVLAGEHFNRKTYNICVSVFEVSLWVVIIALIKLLFINTEIETSSEWMIYIYLLILLVLRNFIKFRSLIM